MTKYIKIFELRVLKFKYSVLSVKMSGNLNHESITYPSISTEPLHFKEFADGGTEDSEGCHQMNKRSKYSDLQTKTEAQIEDNDNPPEEENNEEEVFESGTGSRINLTEKTVQEKFEKENNTTTDKCGNRGSNRESRNESYKSDNEKGTIKENCNIAECSLRKKANNNNESKNEKKNCNSARNSGKRNDSNAKKGLKEIGLFALKTAAISGAVIGGTALIVPALGFGALGVTGGSLAAAFQSTFLGGTIASGSAFATLQSIGMVGLSAAAKATVVAGSAAASGVHSVYKNAKNKKD